MLFDLINKNHDSLNDNDLHVLNFIISNIELSLNSTLSELSSLCNVSASTISRTAQKLGFEGFTQFKYFLENEAKEMKKERKSDSGTFKSSVLLEDLSQTLRFFEQNRSLDELYKLMENSRKIFAYGTGHSQNLMVQEFARCLLHSNIFLNIIPSSTEFNTIQEQITKNDLLFVVSLSGSVEKIKPLLNTMKLKKVPIISVTLFNQNELSSLSDYNLYYQLSSYSPITNRNNSTFLTLNLVLALLYEGYANYLVQSKYQQK